MGDEVERGEGAPVDEQWARIEDLSTHPRGTRRVTCCVCGNRFDALNERLSFMRYAFCCAGCYAAKCEPQQHEFTYVPAKGHAWSGPVWLVKRAYELEADRSIVKFERPSRMVILWNDVDGTNRKSCPDFDVTYADGRFVVEDVLGCHDASSKRRIEATRELCENRGVEYRVLNDRHIEPIAEARELYSNSYGLWSRPTFESVYMNVASQFASRSTCLRLQVGAAFVDPTYTRVLSVGYNGGIAGDANQCESLAPGMCGCIHAEVNAMMHAHEPLNGSILFVTSSPCRACAKLIIARGIKKVFYGRVYRDDAGIVMLGNAGIETIDWRTYVSSTHSTAVENQWNRVLSKPR